MQILTMRIVREHLVGFFECDTGITGRDLHVADKITSFLCAYGLELTNIRLMMEQVACQARSMVQQL